MKRFEESLIESWEEWDLLDDGYQFTGCKLKPEWFINKKDYNDILDRQEEFGADINVYYSFSDMGFVVEIYVDDITWRYVPEIVCKGHV